MTALMARRIYPATRDDPGEEGPWFEIDDTPEAMTYYQTRARQYEIRPLDLMEIESEED